MAEFGGLVGFGLGCAVVGEEGDGDVVVGILSHQVQLIWMTTARVHPEPVQRLGCIAYLVTQCTGIS